MPPLRHADEKPQKIEHDNEIFNSVDDVKLEKPHSFPDLNSDDKITVSDAILLARVSTEDVTLNLTAEQIDM